MIDFSEYMKHDEIHSAIIPEAELRTGATSKFLDKAIELTKLYAKKNHDYGDSFNKGMDTIGLSYGIGRMFDKMNRIVNLSKTQAQVTDESIIDTIQDLACYAIMTAVYIDSKIEDVNFE